MVASQCQLILTTEIFTQAESASKMFVMLARLYIRWNVRYRRSVLAVVFYFSPVLSHVVMAISVVIVDLGPL